MQRPQSEHGSRAAHRRSDPAERRQRAAVGPGSTHVLGADQYLGGVAAVHRRTGHLLAGAARRLHRDCVQRGRADAVGDDARSRSGDRPSTSAVPTRRRTSGAGLGGARILEEQDPLTREPKVYHVQFMRSLDRPIFMDGRPHPPAYAPHSWTGFSTGEWIGNTLKVTTTHLKDGFLRRGGPQTTDMYAMTEYITRHGDILTIVTVVDDPLYQDQPYIHSTTYVYDLNTRVNMETCNGSFAENGGTDRHHVPHFLPGTNEDALNEWIRANQIMGGARVLQPPQDWVPLQARSRRRQDDVPGVPRDAERIGQRRQPDGAVFALGGESAETDRRSESTRRRSARAARAGQCLHARRRWHQHHGVARPGGDHAGECGSASMSDKIVAAVNDLAKRIVAPTPANSCFGANCPGMWGWSSPYMNAVIASPTPAPPIRYVVNTSDAPEYTAGNAKLVAAGCEQPQRRIRRRRGCGRGCVGRGARERAQPHERGKAGASPAAALPTVTVFRRLLQVPRVLQRRTGDRVLRAEATSDGESYVYFRRSDVIATGDVFSSVSYPRIDLAKGGSVQGEIRALNAILDLAVAEYQVAGRHLDRAGPRPVVRRG